MESQDTCEQLVKVWLSPKWKTMINMRIVKSIENLMHLYKSLLFNSF